MNSKIVFIVSIFLFSSLAQLVSQTSTSLSASQTSTTNPTTSTTIITSIKDLLNPPRAAYNPTPYRDDEFPIWMQDLRRAEIVTVGTIPFTFLLSSIFFDTYRYIDKSSSGSADALQYAPFFIGIFNPSVSKLPYTSDDIISVFVGSIIISAVLAIIDNIIVNDQRERLRKEAEEIKKRENQALVLEQETSTVLDETDEAEIPDGTAIP